MQSHCAMWLLLMGKHAHRKGNIRDVRYWLQAILQVMSVLTKNELINVIKLINIKLIGWPTNGVLLSIELLLPTLVADQLNFLYHLTWLIRCQNGMYFQLPVPIIMVPGQISYDPPQIWLHFIVPCNRPLSEVYIFNHGNKIPSQAQDNLNLSAENNQCTTWQLYPFPRNCPTLGQMIVPINKMSHTNYAI